MPNRSYEKQIHLKLTLALVQGNMLEDICFALNCNNNGPAAVSTQIQSSCVESVKEPVQE